MLMRRTGMPLTKSPVDQRLQHASSSSSSHKPHHLDYIPLHTLLHSVFFRIWALGLLLLGFLPRTHSPTELCSHLL
ncbi:hypothetical protein SODALDRAFT_56336 [Sodiomyces alkalinus F11]|uniref:Uncharacterized protein n=1 Tax=Sodiomyces alkalinus (strain CBS 110278 / VKM F-3762 / F11) TaxID=1314773 RepID=A0A3N2PNA9_SODAK|nr:hypothetical protein SODALDRAFT_56336 [Sodiomyces alkalinus F11]ROT36017.1 hypothetical protein SODALDRAFT_56336 [Sodiomyces alkalinus F11]